MMISQASVNVFCSKEKSTSKLFFLFPIDSLHRPRAVFKIAICGSFQRLSPWLSPAGREGGGLRGKKHMCGIKKAFLDLLMKYCVRRNFQKKPTNTVIYAAFSRKVFLISEAYFKENVFLNWVIAAKEMEEDEGRNTSEAWGLPISNVDTFSNLTDSQFLVRVLGPKHMGYEVSFEGDAWWIMSFHLVFKSLLKIQFQWLFM